MECGAAKSKHHARTHALRALLAWALLAALPAPSMAEKPLRGTFLQLTSAHGEWTTQNWRSLFDTLAKLELEEIIVQWVAFDHAVFYRSATFDSVPNPPLETLLQLADEYSMRVRLGLSADSQFWLKVDRSAQLIETYFRRRIAANEVLIRELTPVVARHRSFAGWYLSDELDDVSWQDPAKRKVLVAYLRELCANLRRRTPQQSIALSLFSNGAMAPGSLADFAADLMEQAHIDTLLFQDGIGAGKLSLDELSIYLEALRSATKSRPFSLELVIELFQQTESSRDSEEAFRAAPAPIERIQRQLAVAAQHGLATIAFSVPDYLNPQNSPEQQALFEAYLRTIKP